MLGVLSLSTVVEISRGSDCIKLLKGTGEGQCAECRSQRGRIDCLRAWNREADVVRARKKERKADASGQGVIRIRRDPATISACDKGMTCFQKRFRQFEIR